MAEAVAVASPDERRGTVVKAFVVRASGHEPSDGLAEEIKVFVREGHSVYAYPRLIEFVPRSPQDAHREDQADRASATRAGAGIGLGLSLREDSVRASPQTLAERLRLL